jgi:predicted DNA-binding protein (MmcQ/YjbR family)
MHIEDIRQHCLSKKGTIECFPFDEYTLVFKVMNKCFLFAGIDAPLSINLKCDPAFAIELRERYPAVTPGYHMNKQHWNTILIDGSISDKELLKWIDDSYELIVMKLSRIRKKELSEL